MRGPSRRSATLLACLLSGCAAGAPPRVADAQLPAAPDAWTAASAQTASSGALQDDWWRAFGDPRLDELVDLGLSHNPTLKAAAARLEAAAAAHRIAGAPLLPQLDLAFNADRARRLFLGFPLPGTGVPSTTVTTFGLSLGVRWELDVWGRLRSADAAALADQQAAVHELRAAQLSIVGQICRAWFATTDARQQLALARATEAAFDATLVDVRDRFRRGVRPALEVHQAATNLANAEAIVAQREDQLQRARRQLDLLVGRYPDGNEPGVSQLPEELLGVPAGLPSDLLLRRPDLQAAERRLAAAGCRVEAAEAALYPQFALTAAGGTQSLELEDLAETDLRVWSIGANLLQPLLQGGALRAEVQRQGALRAEALAGYGESVLRAFAEVEDLLTSESQLQRRLAALRDAASHATQARDLARERWQLGLTDFLTVADGQRQAFAAEAARLTVTRQRIDNRIDLLLALGGGFGADPATQP